LQRSATDAPLTFAPGNGYTKAAEVANLLANSYESDKAASGTSAQVASAVPKAPTETPAVAGPPFDLKQIKLPPKPHCGSLSYYSRLAFGGWLILNLMPCVLPVIGLKVMSFVEQSGKSRSHALMLNVWFSVGIIAVFLVLGLLAATIGLTWGGQF